MDNNNRKVNCHNCYLDSYEILSKTKKKGLYKKSDTTTYLCRLCNAMEVIVCVEGMASVRYKALRTEIVVDNKWKTN
jgi:hypothetical protein